jgi:DNA helicase II / ATP-dependent DNA helicase PcrA
VPISCVYCGGSHRLPAEVRDCASRAKGVERSPRPDDDLPPIPDEPIESDRWADEPRQPQRFVERSAASNPPASARRSSSPTVASAPARRGPAVLGRHVLVAPSQAAPDEWGDAERLSVDLGTLRAPDPVIARLREAARNRTGLAIELDAEAERLLGAARATSDAPHRLGPRFTFELDTLHHLVIANSVDGRSGATWQVSGRAVALGATVIDDGRGDVQLPDGNRVWLDGGPLRWFAPIDGVPVLHRIALDHGSVHPFGANTTSAELAPDQLAAVAHDGGAARIIAPAGSGKTRVLTERVRHLVRQGRLPVGAITLVAFNKRAQEEMTARTADLPGLQIRTLNALALMIVNGVPPFAAQPQRVQTIDEPAVRDLLGKLVTFPRKRNSDPAAAWIDALSAARLGLRDPVQVEADAGGDVPGFADVVGPYREALRRRNVVDFDEQVIRAIELLLTDPDTRAAAQHACRLMLVDEFQDLTPAHLLMVRLLAGPDGNVFGVGDDDQTIYGYNGADPAWLIEFAQLFPDAGDHPLTVNYRCPVDVVASADRLVRHNRRRVPKVIHAASDEQGLVVHEPGDSVAATVDALRQAIDDGFAPNEIAVLTRVNSLLVPVQVAAGAAGLATNGGVGREFLDRTAVRATFAWMRLVTGSKFAAADLGEALRRPSRSLHPRIADWAAEQRDTAALRKLADRLDNEKDRRTVESFADDLDRLRGMAERKRPTAELISSLFDSVGLAGAVSGLDQLRHGTNRAAQGDDLTALAQLAGLFPDPATFESKLRGALSKPWQAHGVTLATVHRVKGQEWPVVVVHHAADDQYPHRLAEEWEEERRVFHVAITRGRRRVHVVPSESPSPFVANLSNEPPPPRAAGDPPERTPTAKATTPRASAGPSADLEPEHQPMFDHLKDTRRHLAAGKPAYVVFPDSVLKDMARVRPTSIDQLRGIKGVGPTKAQQYGQAFLDAIARFGADA